MTTTQLDAVRVLTGIIRRAEEAGLPRLAWRSYPYDGAGLEAQPWGDEETDRLTALTAWAAHLGVEVAVEKTDRYVKHAVRAEVDGVTVEIFALTGETHTYVAVPIAKAGGAK